MFETAETPAATSPLAGLINAHGRYASMPAIDAGHRIAIDDFGGDAPVAPLPSRRRIRAPLQRAPPDGPIASCTRLYAVRVAV